MNHWARMLADLPVIAQQTIARYQRISLPHQCTPEERVLRLRQALCRQATVRAVYQTLAADEQAALHVLRDLHAGMRPAALALRFGPLRSWSQLAKDPVARTVSERLVLLGWLLPRPATPHHPERLLLPPELRRWLPQPLVIPRVAPAPHTPFRPPLIVTASALVLASARQPLPLRADGRLRQSALREFACLADLSTDLAGLLNTTLDLLCGLGVLTRHAGAASPTPAVGGFLGLPCDQRLERLRSAWVEVITLSAKADSFSGHALPIGTRFVLKARSEPEHVLRGVHVSIGNISAVSATMLPICQRLSNQRQFPATTTPLSRIVRRNCDHGDTSFFRFVRQDQQERSPRDIKGGLRKPTTGNTPNVQIFVNNRTVARNQGTRRLVVEIPPQIADPLMLLLQHTNGFPATVAALLSARNTPLRQPQRGLSLPIVPWRRNAFIVRCDQEGF
ncbi:hypothetical protein OSCT_0071 [Oscillochloris trichoides DG-6]|uniref:Uncharacterized protein n=1 Tax=Oscillochloris trichoides DG-6 TaxID=765420 RepID=E1I9S0_9CHLR|nr:hypothetical protein [Oscillochloris trichoides]EFO82072.1 hypothetical protein OSCT_0071 [Oscillochloris trichoides DG-6]